MKVLSVLIKSLREQRRDTWTLVLTLISSPLFVLIYWSFFGGGSTRYDVLVINQDAGIALDSGAAWNAGDDVIAALEREVTYEDGQSMLVVKRITDRDAAEKKLKDRDAEALLLIPANFSQALMRGSDPPAVTLVGDLTNTYYAVAAVLTTATLENYAQALGGQPPAVTIREEALGGSAARTEFELYVPGLLIFAVLMLIYQASMVLTHEVEAGTLARLRITRMSAFDLLAGVSLSQVIIGVAGILLTFLTAVALGFDSRGPLWVAVLVGATTSLSCIGMGLLVACVCRTVSQAFMVSTFPLFLMMFFSGVFLPVGEVPLFTLGGRTFQLFDLLPPTQAVVALNKVLTLGEGLGDILFELAVVLALSALYFAAGVWLFRRTHLRRA